MTFCQIKKESSKKSKYLFINNRSLPNTLGNFEARFQYDNTASTELILFHGDIFTIKQQTEQNGKFTTIM